MNIMLILVIITGAFLSVALGRLTAGAAVAGSLLAMAVHYGAGWTGVALMASFFLLGTMATSWKKKWKEQKGMAEANKGRRKASQVWANAGVGALCGIGAYLLLPQAPLFQLAMAAAFSAATADTLSSELGSVYGKKFYHITTLERGERGLDGVVSLEGFFFGAAGSLLIALVYAAGFGFTIDMLYIIIAGTIGNIVDSLLGATLERKNIMKNDWVNFCCTLSGAMVVVLMKAFF